MSATEQETYTTTFTVEVEPHRDVVHVRPHGELELATVDVLRERIDDLTATGFTRLLLSLTELTFLDSAGLRLILDLERSSHAAGWQLAVVPGPSQVQRLFDLTGTQSLVPFTDGSGAPAPPWGRAWR